VLSIHDEGKISVVCGEREDRYSIALILNRHLGLEIKNYVIGQEGALSAVYILADFPKTRRLSHPL
jgi:hypothetical protein